MLAWSERQLGRYSFLGAFVLGYLIAVATSGVLGWGFAHSFTFQTWFFRFPWLTIPLMLIFQVGALLYLMVRLLPTWMDNNYKHDNRADNMGSLRRVKAEAAL